ncbi:MAG: hypothetical protein H0T84_03955 [Tatlockia sp.]|nr:hypothetical protein [Tatlockia sp.]
MSDSKELIDESSKINYLDFDRKLLAETALLENWFIDKVFIERELAIGSEIECFLLDRHYNPAPDNLRFSKLVNKPYLVCEGGAAQLEINSGHFSFTSDCLSKLHGNILKYWQHSCEIARQNNYHLALIGTLPTATEQYHLSNFITQESRYQLINSCIAEQRAGRPITINIEGVESLSLHPESLAMIGLISAFQIHMQMGLSQSVRYYNIAQAIAAPVLAISCNSPYIFRHQVWADTRIVIFDQLMTIAQLDTARGFKCCFFGFNYLKDSLYELFDQNFQFYPRLNPILAPQLPIEAMFHVQKQNSVVYRWNRPVIDFNQLNQPHLRIEHRGPSVGPTVVDMIANAAFFLGLLNYYAVQETPIECLLPFYDARKNFYKAARSGLNAQFQWFLGQKISACDLIKNLLPLARKGLQIFGIDSADIKFYLDLVEKRNALKMNGSEWQCRFIKKYGQNFHNMMAEYLENQYLEVPVSEWKV